jgi:excinuclease UvrABC ATPase subunit
MGPEGGKKGGEVIFQGIPEELVLWKNLIQEDTLKKYFK